jgi:predicted transcriptional regulator
MIGWQMSAITITIPDMGKESDDKKQYLAARVAGSLVRALKAMGDASDRSLSYMTEQAIREYVERHSEKTKGK